MRRDPMNVVLTVLAAALWFAAALMFFHVLPGEQGGYAVGGFLAALAATQTLVVVVRVCVTRTRRSFVHGYHAGYHDGVNRSCTGLDPYCDVLDISEVRMRRLERSSG